MLPLLGNAFQLSGGLWGVPIGHWEKWPCQLYALFSGIKILISLRWECNIMHCSVELIYWSLGDENVIFKLIHHFKAHIKYIHLEQFLYMCPQVTVTRPHWSFVNTGSGNGLVPSGNNSYTNKCWLSSVIWHHCWCTKNFEISVSFTQALQGILGNKNTWLYFYFWLEKNHDIVTWSLHK